eukprot:g6056.t1
MAQFLIKIVNHFASEIITKRLANSRAFQRLAMKTHLKIEETKKMAENPEETAKILRGVGEKVKAEADSVTSSFERFKAALKEEVSGGAGGAASSSSGRSTATAASRRKAPPKRGPTSPGGMGGGIKDDIAARVQRRRR